jgi:hypothetical protein
MGRDRSSGGARLPRVQRANLQVGFLVRMVVLASAAVIASAWGLVRYYTHRRTPPPSTGMPARADAGWDAGQGLIEAPEIEVERR